MSEPDTDEDVYLWVSLCDKCPDIHLIIKQGDDFSASVALTDEDWQELIAEYHKLRQDHLARGGASLQ